MTTEHFIRCIPLGIINIQHNNHGCTHNPHSYWNITPNCSLTFRSCCTSYLPHKEGLGSSQIVGQCAQSQTKQQHHQKRVFQQKEFQSKSNPTKKTHRNPIFYPTPNKNPGHIFVGKKMGQFTTFTFTSLLKPLLIGPTNTGRALQGGLVLPWWFVVWLCVCVCFFLPWCCVVLCCLFSCFLFFKQLIIIMCL